MRRHTGAFLLADHQVYEEPLTRTSPWLVLFGQRAARPCMRNLSGSPARRSFRARFRCSTPTAWRGGTRARFGESQRPFRLLASSSRTIRTTTATSSSRSSPDGVHLGGDGRRTDRPTSRRTGLWARAIVRRRRSGRCAHRPAILAVLLPPAGAHRPACSTSSSTNRTTPKCIRLSADWHFCSRPTASTRTGSRSEQDRDAYQLSDTNALFEADCQRSCGAVPLRAERLEYAGHSGWTPTRWRSN